MSYCLYVYHDHYSIYPYICILLPLYLPYCRYFYILADIGRIGIYDVGRMVSRVDYFERLNVYSH